MKSLGKCVECKYNENGYCKKYNSKAVTSQDLKYCTRFRKKTKTPIRNTIKKKSVKQEKQLAKDLGARRTPQSGAQTTSPNDMTIKGGYVLESKATKSKSISLKKEWLEQLKQSPINFGKIPVLVVEFSIKDRYIIMDNKDFLKIVNTEPGKGYIKKEDLIKEDKELQKCNELLDRLANNKEK